MEKIKVNLSYLTYSTIINDAEAFQIYKTNGEINKNEIFNRIVANLSEEDFKNKIEKKNKYKNVLSNIISDETQINKIIEGLELANENSKIKRNDVYDQIVMIRPSKVYEDIFNKIIYNYLDNTSISSYFRNLFDYYASLYQEERERIIFKKELEKLNEAINHSLSIKIKIGANISTFNVYKVVTSKEKLFNYVLGVVETPSNKRKTISLHLNKVKDVIITNKSSILHKNEIEMLNNMIKVGPQFIAGEFIDAKVQLTNLGLRKYRTIFLNRPVPYKKEENIYYFKCSRNQLFQYFSRFGVDAFVIEPKILRDDILKFHQASYEKIIRKSKNDRLNEFIDVFVEREDYDSHKDYPNKILHNCRDSSYFSIGLIDTLDDVIDYEYISIEQNEFELLMPILQKHIPFFDMYNTCNPIKSETLKLILDDVKEYINISKDYEIKRLLEALVWYFEEHKMVYTLGNDLDSKYIINIYGL